MAMKVNSSHQSAALVSRAPKQKSHSSAKSGAQHIGRKSTRATLVSHSTINVIDKNGQIAKAKTMNINRLGSQGKIIDQSA